MGKIRDLKEQVRFWRANFRAVVSDLQLTMKEHVSLKERYDIQCDHLVKTCDVFRREVYALNCRPSRAELDNSISMYNREVRDHRKTSDALQAAKDRLIDATPLITENVHSSSN